LYFALRPVRGASGNTRDGFGWPTRSRALAFTAFAAENPIFFRFVIVTMSMEQKPSAGKNPSRARTACPNPSARETASVDSFGLVARE